MILNFKEFLKKREAALLKENKSKAACSELFEKYDNHSYGCVSAEKSGEDNETNTERTLALFGKIVEMGFQHVRYSEQNKDGKMEKCFFVYDKNEKTDGKALKKFLIEVGKIYDQDCILFRQYGEEPILYGTSTREDSYPGLDKEVPAFESECC